MYILSSLKILVDYNEDSKDEGWRQAMKEKIQKMRVWRQAIKEKITAR